MRIQREKIQSGWKEIRGLKAMVGRKCCISRGEARLNSEVYKLEESEEDVTMFSPEEAGRSRGQLQE